MPKTYKIYLPAIEGSVEEEWKLCLNKIENTCLSGYIPVKLNVFIDVPDFESFLKAREKISQSVSDKFSPCCPALNITVHPPEKPWKVAVEASFIPSGKLKVTGKIFSSIPYLIIESETGKEIWAGGVSSYLFPEDTRKAAEKAFDLMVAILENEQMSLNNLIRQWNYIGNILDIKDEYQNYQIFNEVRNDYYSRYRKMKGYPAATGVGMKHGGVILDFCAVELSESLKIRAVENPNQINAYNYGQQVLMGLKDKDKATKHAPQFERALLVANNHDAYLHISGTASIIGQETIGKNDIGKQTIVTIENVKKLTETERINKLISGPVISGEKYSLFRIYIKKQSDFRIVHQIFNEQFPGIPAIYVEADICRDDLLMEIEAEVELT
jgi:enamine deaminase RidA (YjgF/YER057c/UK114 family)